MGKNRSGKKIKVALLGASFTTGNLGVSALAESSIRCILKRWPDADINFLGGGREAFNLNMNIDGRIVHLKNIPVRFSKNIFIPDHIFIYVMFAIMRYVIPIKNIHKYFINRNLYIKELIETDYVMDITGGDSFSDIYGIQRFLFGFFPKCMVLLYRIPLIFLPQTYGPFGKKISKLLAGFVVRKARLIFSRDEYSLSILNKLFGSNGSQLMEKTRHVPDVAFILPPEAPERIDIQKTFKKMKDDIIVGLNISGLLYHGGYTGDNMFALNVEYRELISSIIDYFMKIKHTKILLIPHVISQIPPDVQVQFTEDDSAVCRDVYINNIKKYPGRIFVAEGKYNHREIKYIIGMTDFFLGSRMHACIAALSQCIPAIGLAYSRKFSGVFATIGVENCVVDMRNENHDDLISKISRLYNERKQISSYLKRNIPDIKQRTINILFALED